MRQRSCVHHPQVYMAPVTLSHIVCTHILSVFNPSFTLPHTWGPSHRHRTWSHVYTSILCIFWGSRCIDYYLKLPARKDKCKYVFVAPLLVLIVHSSPVLNIPLLPLSTDSLNY
ncbi:uncharacterized protein BJ212DRAFT_1402550 [Suillus subaureus]|uniref:Uncharacterized protein n=1 Tax=Suillus subaureus TaxID=48587 RepID=A0A9P7DNC6_9AGAM|nr:uncharacterized protein BJ212DRAFT_1402550 [Suillus subaureus]KAG1799108.1 hypothetical protein BJ212DRAFT_1402550 [Suillus subaureus]